MTTHFFSMSAGLAEKVFMAQHSVAIGEHVLLPAAHTPAARLGSTPASIFPPTQAFIATVLYYRWHWRDRIRRRRVGDGLRLALRVNGDLAGGEPLAELEQPRFREGSTMARAAPQARPT